MDTHHVTRKIKAGKRNYAAGRVVDATRWRNRRLLVATGYLEPLPREASVTEAGDGTRWLGTDLQLGLDARPEPDPGVTYPVYVPVGRWEFSNGEVKRMKKVDALVYEENLA